MAELEKIGGLTRPEINALKKQHNTKNVFLITVKLGSEQLFFWLKKPDMTVLSAFVSMAEKDPVAANQMMFKDCLIKGEESYANDPSVFVAISKQLNDIVEAAESTMEKF